MKLPFPADNKRPIDFHVHTHYSLDIPNGPSPEDYLEIAEEHGIQICFTDHYELYYKNGNYKRDLFGKRWIYDEDGLIAYIEKMDSLKSRYKFIFSGLEVDYYPDMEEELAEFIDDYGKDFDYLLGSMHEVEHTRPVTIYDDLIYLIEKYGSFNEVERIYWQYVEKMIDSGLFGAVAHIDTVYRFCNPERIRTIPKYNAESMWERILRKISRKGIFLEWNLSGKRYPIARTFPSEKIICRAVELGINIIVGTDSHSVETFGKFIPELKRAYEHLRKLEGGCKKNGRL